MFVLLSFYPLSRLMISVRACGENGMIKNVKKIKQKSNQRIFYLLAYQPPFEVFVQIFRQTLLWPQPIEIYIISNYIVRYIYNIYKKKIFWLMI